MNDNIFVALIGLLGLFLGAVFQKVNNDKSNYLKNITQERKEWRKTIRELTEELNKENADYRILKVKFQIRLNPVDNDDNEILNIIDKLIKQKDKECQEKLIKEFNTRVALLLKHDWERVKLEANKTSFFPYGAILIVLFTITIIIQFYVYRFQLIQSVKQLIDKDFIFHFIFHFFTMAWLFILFHIMISLSSRVQYFVYKLFKLPVREKYKDKIY